MVNMKQNIETTYCNGCKRFTITAFNKCMDCEHDKILSDFYYYEMQKAN